MAVPMKVELNHKQIHFLVCMLYYAYELMIQKQQLNKNDNRKAIPEAAALMNRLSEIASKLGDATCTVSFSEPERQLILFILSQTSFEKAGEDPASEVAQVFTDVKSKLLAASRAAGAGTKPKTASIEKRNSWFIAGNVCGYKSSIADGPMPDSTTMKRCGRIATVGVPIRVSPTGVPVSCDIAEAQGGFFFCDEHWSVALPTFYDPGTAAQLVPVPKSAEEAN
jgi:hypothetical protein